MTGFGEMAAALLGRGFELTAALALLAICAALGWPLVRLFRIPDLTRTESLLLAVPPGTAVVSLALLALGAAGGFRPLPLGLTMAALALVSLAAGRGLPSSCRAALREFRPSSTPEPDALAVMTTAGAALFLLAMALAPPVDWDTLMYHLEIPARFLDAGRVYLLEDSLRVSYANVVHMLYVPLLALGAESGPAVVSAVFALFLVISVYAFSSRFLPGVTPGLAAATVFGTTTILVVAITPRVDVTLAFVLFAAHYLVIIGWTGRRRGPLLFAALLLGLAVGVKYHALPYILALSPLLIWTAWRVSGSGAGMAGTLTAMAALAAGACAPWLVKNWVLLGAPLYPLLSEPLLTPWLRTVTGTSGLPADADPGLTRIVWSSRATFNLRDLFLAPERLSIEYEGRFYHTNPLLLLLPLALWVARNPVVPLLAGPALAYLLILLVPFPDTNIRYLLPAIPPLTIVAAYTAARAAERWLKPRALGGALVILAVASLVPTMRSVDRWLGGTRPARYLTGRLTAHGYRARHFIPDVNSFAPATKMVNDSLAADARVLMLFEDRAFGFRPDMIADVNAMTWPLLATREPAATCLAGVNVTHVLVGRGAARYYLEGGADSAVLALPALDAFAERCLDLVGKTGGHELYRVRGESRLSDTHSAAGGARSAP